MKQTTYQEIFTLLVPRQKIYSFRIIGSVLYMSINPKNILRVSLHQSSTMSYSGFNLCIINKNFGKIDDNIVYFSTNSHKQLTAIDKHAGTFEWDNPLSKCEIDKIRTQIEKYIDMFDGLLFMDC